MNHQLDPNFLNNLLADYDTMPKLPNDDVWDQVPNDDVWDQVLVEAWDEINVPSKEEENGEIDDICGTCGQTFRFCPGHYSKRIHGVLYYI